MTPQKITEWLQQGEGQNLEFKTSRTKANRDVYETICAFLNRQGGTLLLGVADDGSIAGIEPNAVSQIKKDIVNALHNQQKINPPVYLAPEEIEIEQHTILCIAVPESSQVHTCNGRIFDRNEDGDFDITAHSQQVAELYLRKQVTYSENRVYPYVELSDLRLDLIRRVRTLVSLHREDHPWINLDDLSLLKSARLYRKDYMTGKEGISMAGVLLFGQDDVILSVVPHHRTDALLRVRDLDRYDDRDDIRTNLIESYDRLMAFVAKHIADPFYLERDLRISLRDRIFREVVVNMLIHREYLNPFPAKLIIHNDTVTTENSNNPHGTGTLDPSTFTPSPKNPVIARVFKEIALADELGSGVRNLFKYGKVFSGRQPLLQEESIFRVTVPIPSFVQDLSTAQVTEQATAQVTEQADREQLILEYCQVPRTRTEIQERVGIKHREYFRKEILQPLIDKGLISLTLPDKPNSPNQKYKTHQPLEP